MQRSSKPVLWLGLAVSGVALMCVAGFVSSVSIEHMVGRNAGELVWGPALFRILLASHGVLLLSISLSGERHSPASATTTAVPGLQKTGWKTLALLSALTFGAMALRLWRLDSCLWFDELSTLLDFVRPPLGMIVTSFPSQNQHMFYSILAHTSIGLFGESAWALRLPSVLFGTASVWALFWFGRRVVGKTEALLGCALLTVSYHHIWFSQNARGYVGLMFFATMASWLFLEALDKDAWPWWILYSLAVFGGLWTHLTMLFVPAAHFLVFIIILLRSWVLGRSGSSLTDKIQFSWKPICAWLLCGTLTLQAYALSLPEFFRSALHEGVAMRSEWSSPLWAIQAFVRGLQVGWLGAGVLVCGAVIAFLGFATLWQKDWRAATVMVLPSILGGASMLALGHPLWPRFFFFSVGFALVIIVRGTMEFPRVVSVLTRNWRPSNAVVSKAGVVLTMLVIAISSTTISRNYALPKQDYTGARQYVEMNRHPSEPVIAAGLAGVAYGRYFAPHWLAALSKQELDKALKDYPDPWLVYTIPAQIRSVSADFWGEIQEDFVTVKVFPGTLGDGAIYVCRRRSGAFVSDTATGESGNGRTQSRMPGTSAQRSDR